MQRKKADRTHFGCYRMLCMWWFLDVEADSVNKMSRKLILTVAPGCMGSRSPSVTHFPGWSSYVLSSSLCGSCCSVDFSKCLQEQHIFILSQDQWSWPLGPKLLTILLVTAIAQRYQSQSQCYEHSSCLDSQGPHCFLSCLSRVICSKSNRIDSSVFFTVTDSISEFTDLLSLSLVLCRGCFLNGRSGPRRQSVPTGRRGGSDPTLFPISPVQLSQYVIISIQDQCRHSCAYWFLVFLSRDLLCNSLPSSTLLLFSVGC